MGSKFPIPAPLGEKPAPPPPPPPKRHQNIYGEWVTCRPGNAADLLARLARYEARFEAYFVENPKATEQLADTVALYDAGLTQQGLLHARVLAGKPASMRPGVLLTNTEIACLSG